VTRSTATHSDLGASGRRLLHAAARLAAVGAAAGLGLLILGPNTLNGGRDALGHELRAELEREGFTGRMESTLPRRLGRRVDVKLANLGRLLWFDTVTGLNGDNTCAGCHSPTNGFGDTQAIAIGIENNGMVGPSRRGPRNMRRAPMVINTAFFPVLMWNSRFSSLSGDPFDNSAGFLFPPPEGMTLSNEDHLLLAQAFIPPTERTEVTGFGFDGDNEAIRAEVARRLDAVPAYRRLFGEIFPGVRSGAPIEFSTFARAVAEFEFSLTFANAPIDRFARGDEGALTSSEERGGLLFFGQAGCAGCHSVSGTSNEMFTDFRTHAIGVPQLVPELTNNQFDGTAADEDFGRREITGDVRDSYAFRTPSFRNVAVEAAYMHDGAFTSLRAAIRHHLDVRASLVSYDPSAQTLPSDLAGPIGPVVPLLEALDPLVSGRIELTATELDDLVAFVARGLLDPRAEPARLRTLVPKTLPSGRPPLTFEFGR
jgi:cytochrome c peroxidase